jgi:hypothetical protein
MQVLGVLTPLLPLVKAQYPHISSISVQSDNASCLPSHDIIACIHHLNKELDGLLIKVVPWICTEAQASKGRLDTHLSDIGAEQRIDDAVCHLILLYLSLR